MKTAILHMGVHKTGTTAIQNWLDQNRSRLAQAGLAIPFEFRSPSYNFRPIAHSLCSPQAALRPAHREIPGRLSTWLEEQQDRDILISAEYFNFAMAESRIRPATTFFAERGYRVRAVVFLRNPVDFINALFLQWRKAMQPKRFSQAIEQMLGTQLPVWARSLEYLETCVDDLAVGAYPPATGTSGLVRSFCDLAGITHRLPDGTPFEIGNFNTTYGLFGLMASGHLLNHFHGLTPKNRATLGETLEAAVQAHGDIPVRIVDTALRDRIENLCAASQARLSRWLDPSDVERLSVTRCADTPLAPDRFEELEEDQRDQVRAILDKTATQVARDPALAAQAPPGLIRAIDDSPFALREMASLPPPP